MTTATKTGILTDAATLLAALDTCMATVARDDMRPVLQAVKVIANSEKTTYVAADGYALTVVDVTGVSGTFDGLIPADTVQSIIALLKRIPKRERELINVELREDQFTVVGTPAGNGGGAVIPITMVAGTFPDYEKLIPKRNGDHASYYAVNAKFLKLALTVADRYADSGIFRIFPAATPSSPTTITWQITEHVNVRYVLMPMFVTWTENGKTN